MKKGFIYFVMLFIPTMLLSQTEITHFKYETHTNSYNTANIAIPFNISPNVEGASLVTGDEIGVFNTKDICCGAVVWKEATAMVIAYGTENNSTLNHGFAAGEAIYFKIWVKQSNREYNATVTYNVTGVAPYSTIYANNGIYMLSSLSGGVNNPNPPGTGGPGTNPGGPGTNPSDVKTPSVPDEIKISQNYPNPFNPSTKIEIFFPHSAHFGFDIYDINGKLIRNLNHSFVTSGNYLLEWDGKDNNKMQVSSGIYFYRISYLDKIYTGKMVLEK
jgi:hypothetical protein